MINNKIEILSPAGNLEKLKYAVNYGSDAVYLALKSFGMRAAADNFTFDELREGIEYAHSKGVKDESKDPSCDADLYCADRREPRGRPLLCAQNAGRQKDARA